MPKTLTPVQSLQLEIERIQSAIASKEREFLSQQQENSEYAESLRILEAGTQRYIPEGTIPPLDALTRLLEEGDSEADRQYRWNAANQALELSKAQSNHLQSQLEQLRQQLALAEAEFDWLENYEPHAERYRSGFKMPSPEQKKQERVEALQKDIAERRLKLERAQAWIKQKEDERSYYGGNVWEEARYLSEAIPILSEQLEQLIAEPVAQDKEYEAKFREYVKGRVRVEPMLGDLLKAQREYLIALDVFKVAIDSYPQAAEFSAAVLSEPRIVSAETSIRLV